MVAKWPLSILSDEEWSQGDEIALFDMSEGGDSVRIMNETALDDIITEHKRRLIYVYDFLFNVDIPC